MGRVFDLLIVDDDPSQLKLVRTLIAELGLQHRCHYVLGGPDALNFLHRNPPFEAAPRPDLMLLDLNMPGLNGCEVLHHIKSDVNLRSIPVVMLSNSLALKDVISCYEEHANAYIRKPADLESNRKLLRDIDRFWAGCALTPR